MDLPNYFLADLGPEAAMSATLVTEACQTLRRNRERYLTGRRTADIVRLLSGVARNWLQPDDPFRRRFLEQGPTTLGFSAATLARGLDSFFREFTPENFDALLEQELGHPGRLDDFCAVPAERQRGRSAWARGPELLVHVAAGNLPVAAGRSLALGLLVRSAQFVKCANGASLWPRLFAHSLYEADAKVGACLEIAEWPGGASVPEEALFAAADCVTATGTDETLAAIRERLPRRTRFIGHGHRLSFGYVTAEAVRGPAAEDTAARVAADVAAWNQWGCLSPHVIYVEPGGVAPEDFAALLAQALEKLEAVEPRGPLPAAEAATIASRRSFYEVRAAHSPETRHWASPDSTAWTVVFEADPQFQASCLNRFIYVKPAPDLATVLRAAETVRETISTVGLAAPPERARELASALARWGVPRICPLGRMQAPPLGWRHDGRPALGELLTWTDWEMNLER